MSVFTFRQYEGTAGHTRSSGSIPHPLTQGPPPSQNPPGPGKGRGDEESDVSERRHGRGYSAINSAISQEIGAEFDSML